jgi:hypothetical protein
MQTDSQPVQLKFAVNPELPKSGSEQANLEMHVTSSAPSDVIDALVTRKQWSNEKEKRLAKFFAENIDKAIKKKMRTAKAFRPILCSSISLRMATDVFNEVSTLKSLG